MLIAFENSGLIHRVLTSDGIIRYSFTRTEKEHLHFVCDKCKSIICLNDIDLPKIDMPDGYTLSKTDLFLHGTCKLCNKFK